MAKNNIAARWLVGTLGLVLIAFGVALSLKSNLGTAPPSCPPAVLNLRWGAISFGTFTWMMHLLFIAAQMAMRRKVLDIHYLIQLAAAFVFGYLCDACIWLLKGVDITSYLMKIVLILVAVLLTAVGIRLEVIGKTWILAGDQVVDTFSTVTGVKFSNAKIGEDILLVALSAAFAWICFGSPWGDGAHTVIREGTLILAGLTGLCMKLTDPLVDKVFKSLLHE
jgi:Predicted membrane protein